MTRRLTSRAGFTAALLGAMLLAELVVTNVLFTADRDLVYFLGSSIHYVCSARAHYGVPCPTCGLTRGFVLTVHGEPGEAWRLSPTGPLTVFGMLAMSVMLMIYAVLQQAGKDRALGSMRRFVQAAAVTYGSVATVIWASTWISTVVRMKGHL